MPQSPVAWTALGQVRSLLGQALQSTAHPLEFALTELHLSLQAFIQISTPSQQNSRNHAFEFLGAGLLDTIHAATVSTLEYECQDANSLVDDSHSERTAAYIPSESPEDVFRTNSETKKISALFSHYASLIRNLQSAIKQYAERQVRLKTQTHTNSARLAQILDRFFRGIQPAVPNSDPHRIPSSDVFEAEEIAAAVERVSQMKANIPTSGLGTATATKVSRAIFWLESARSRIHPKLRGLIHDDEEASPIVSTPLAPSSPEVNILFDLIKSSWLLVDIDHSDEYDSLPEEVQWLLAFLQSLYSAKALIIDYSKLETQWPSISKLALPWELSLSVHSTVLPLSSASTAEAPSISSEMEQYPTSVNTLVHSTKFRPKIRPFDATEPLHRSNQSAGYDCADSAWSPYQPLTQQRANISSKPSNQSKIPLSVANQCSPSSQTQTPEIITPDQQTAAWVQSVAEHRKRNIAGINIQENEMTTNKENANIYGSATARTPSSKFLSSHLRPTLHKPIAISQQFVSEKIPINANQFPNHLQAPPGNVLGYSSSFPGKPGDQFSPNLHYSDLIPIVAPSSGLLVRDLEENTLDLQVADYSTVKPHEIEIANSETKEMWHTRLETSFVEDLLSPEWVQSSVKVFRGEWAYNGPNYRLWVDRKDIFPREIIFGIQRTELVPVYAFPRHTPTTTSTVPEDIYLRATGADLRVRFRFQRSSLEGGLLGYLFEGEYRIQGLLFQPKKDEAEFCSRTSLQVWRDSSSSSVDSNNTKASPVSSKVSAVPKTFGQHNQELRYNHLKASRVFFFMEFDIYVLFISDRLELRKPRTRKFKAKSAPSASLTIFPKRSDAVKYLRIRRLHGTPNSLPGIPLDSTCLRFDDQNRDDWYRSYESIRIDFSSEEDFEANFTEQVNHWREQRKAMDRLRRGQQLPIVQTKGVLVKASDAV
ncbi:hypothetical protein CC78DRAFT_566797 [Lojkania enalia]|uniref:Uncharacterized protein n=1 Tax=Lojkania enalia TaxID=147567 RepID=A0A9P4KET3_9PLEO|nr:hypothetical protein CC78DRAFT_566797 [Didymosphaeria enalia]